MFLECNLCLPRRKTLSFPWWKKYYLGYFNCIKGNTLTKQSFKMIKAFLQFTRPEKGHTNPSYNMWINFIEIFLSIFSRLQQYKDCRDTYSISISIYIHPWLSTLSYYLYHNWWRKVSIPFSAKSCLLWKA